MEKDSSSNKQPIALVTGANQGVGFQIAKALAENGYTVYVGSRNPGNGEKAAADIGFNARSIVLDVTRQSTITTAAARIAKEHGHLDLLVNNAGISHAGKPGRTLEEVVEANRARRMLHQLSSGRNLIQMPVQPILCKHRFKVRFFGTTIVDHSTLVWLLG